MCLTFFHMVYFLSLFSFFHQFPLAPNSHWAITTSKGTQRPHRPPTPTKVHLFFPSNFIALFSLIPLCSLHPTPFLRFPKRVAFFIPSTRRRGPVGEGVFLFFRGLSHPLPSTFFLFSNTRPLFAVFSATWTRSFRTKNFSFECISRLSIPCFLS